MSRNLAARHRIVRALFYFACLTMAACQSGTDLSRALDPQGTATETVSEPPSTPRKTATLGKGSTKVAMLLPLSAAGAVGEAGRRMQDGAKLAMSDMGESLITLTIEDTRGDPEIARKKSVEAMGSGARVVIGPTELPAAKHIAKITGPKRPPVLALADNFGGSAGVYSVLLSEADSAAAAAAALAARGKRKFVLFVAHGEDADLFSKRVANSLSIYGASLAMTMPYRSAGGTDKAVLDMMAVVDRPDAVIVASGRNDPATLARVLRTKGLLGKSTALIGTSRWTSRALNDASLDGAYIATLDATETGPIASRFRSQYGYDADLDAAYAYDMVAMTAGIASAMGPKGLTRQVLETRSGFRGSTGLFRFRADGGSERTMSLYQIRKGSLKEIEKSISGF